MALRTYGSFGKFTKQFSAAGKAENVGVAVPIVKITTDSPSVLSGVSVKIVGDATMPPEVTISRKAPGFRAARLRSKVDQAIRESKEAKEKAKGSGDVVVIA